MSYLIEANVIIRSSGSWNEEQAVERIEEFKLYRCFTGEDFTFWFVSDRHMDIFAIVSSFHHWELSTFGSGSWPVTTTKALRYEIVTSAVGVEDSPEELKSTGFWLIELKNNEISDDEANERDEGGLKSEPLLQEYCLDQDNGIPVTVFQLQVAGTLVC
ncbi:hypothetical protein Rs2_22009 [Raphanus sativus]|nr:hypothetical protein Rs2_22009 [Raphanus sativus]